MLDLLQSVCSIPTAPFCEHRVYEWIEAFARKHKRIRVQRDRVGNVLLTLPGKGPRTIMVAHTDHPGFIAQSMKDAHHVIARFHGGVSPKFFVGSKVQFFDRDNVIAAKVVSIQSSKVDREITATLKVAQPVPTGTLGMWDQGAGRMKGKKFLSRVCDDLAGVASALAVMAKLARKPPKQSVGVLLTRAEEEGFIGAIFAARDLKLLKKSDRIISIECSAEQPYAKQGDGMILRTGDRTSIFNSAFSRFLHTRAEALQKKDKRFKFQRALMPGGTCEATVFDAWRYCAAAVCVPLGNYHNMNKITGKIGPEYVDVRDWTHLVQLLTDVAQNTHEFKGDFADLKDRLNKRFAKFEPLLRTR